MEDLQALARESCEHKGAELLLLGLCGAHAYGTNTDQSDQDVRGVFLPPWTSLVGLRQMETIEREPDIVLHALRKAFKLWSQGNPNMLDWLFLPDDCLWYLHPVLAEVVWPAREAFLSKRLHARFKGYAHSHFQKMIRKQTRELGAKRKAAMEEFGYSPKNAMHLIRLARMGCEVLESGQYNARRSDAEELLEIRRGEWELDKVQEEGARLLARMDVALDRSPLPEKPDLGYINGLLVEVTLQVTRLI